MRRDTPFLSARMRPEDWDRAWAFGALESSSGADHTWDEIMSDYDSYIEDINRRELRIEPNTSDSDMQRFFAQIGVDIQSQGFVPSDN